MDVVIIPRDARLNRHENALVVTSDAGRKSIPLNGVKHVLCMGEGSISIRLLKDMGRRGIRFTVLDTGGRFLGAFEPEDETPSGRVRIGQARLFLDEASRLRIARTIVSAQVKSMRGLLQRYRRNGTAALDPSLEGLEKAIDIVDGATSIEVLMGAEGQARAFLHDAFERVSPDAKLERRMRRPPPDPVNCLMSSSTCCSTPRARTSSRRLIWIEVYHFSIHRGQGGVRSQSTWRRPSGRCYRTRSSCPYSGAVNSTDHGSTGLPGCACSARRGGIKTTERFWSRIEEQCGNLTFRQTIHRQCLSLERKRSTSASSSRSFGEDDPVFVMVCYDVPSKRTEIYKKILKEFLIHEQASVFMGDLPESEIVKLVAKISQKIGPDDRVMKLVCRNRHNIKVCRLSKEALGGQMRQDEDNWHGKNWALV